MLIDVLDRSAIGPLVELWVTAMLAPAAMLSEWKSKTLIPLYTKPVATVVKVGPL